MLILRWAIALVAAAATYMLVGLVGLTLVSGILHMQGGFTAIFVICSLCSVGAAALCMPQRLRFNAAATVTTIFVLLAIVNTWQAFQAHRWTVADGAFMKGTAFGALAPVLSHWTRRRAARSMA